MNSRVALPYVGFALAGLLVGIGVVTLARRESAPQVAVPPTACAPSPSAPVGSPPIGGVNVEPATPAPSEDAIVTAALAARPGTARAAAHAIADRLRADPTRAADALRSAVRLLGEGRTLAGEVLAAAVSSSSSAGLDAVRAELAKHAAGSPGAIRIVLVRALCQFRETAATSAAVVRGAARGEVVVVGSALDGAPTLAAVADCYARTDPGESAVRIECLWGVSGELDREVAAEMVARSLARRDLREERDTAVQLALRMLEQNLPTRGVVERGLSEAVPAAQLALLRLRFEIEDAVLRNESPSDALRRALTSESPEARIALADAIAESQLVRRYATQPAGREFHDAARTLSRDPSRTVRRAAAIAVVELLRQGRWTSPDLMDDVFRLFRDDAADRETRKRLAGEISSMLVGTPVAAGARATTLELLRDTTLDPSARAALLDAVRTLKTNDASFNEWRSANIESPPGGTR